MANLDTGGKPVEDQAADFVRKNCDQVGELAQILFGAVEGSGEMAFQTVGNFEHFVTAGVLDQKGSGAEDFLIQI